MCSVGSGATPARSADERARDLLDNVLPIELSVQEAAEHVQRCVRALAEIEAGDSLLRVRLMASKVIASSHVIEGSRAAIAAEVADMAARLDDDVGRAHALVAWCMVHPTPEHTEARVQAAKDVLEIAARHQEPQLNHVGYLILLVGLLEQGEIRSLDAELLAQRTLTNGSVDGQGVLVERFWCLRSILDGDAEGAEALAAAVLSRTRREGTDFLEVHTAQMSMIRWMQGRYEGLEECLLEARRNYPEQVLWTASLALLWLRQGRRDAGTALLQSLPDPDDIPRNRYWLSTVTVLADAALITGSRTEVAHLHDLLVPFADRLVPVGIGMAFWGTAAKTLGLLEERLGRLTQAREHLELAIDTSARIGALAWHAEAQIELADFAIRHEIADIPAYDLLAQARTTALARGFTGLARRTLHRPRIRVLGRFEVLSLDGRVAKWSSRKARELLKMLVAARGVATSREVFMEVLWPGEPPEQLGNRFSVAITVIRRAFDPERQLPTQYHLITEGDSVRLDLDTLYVDLERFLALAVRADEASRQAARDLYHGDAFSEEVYSDWPERIRDHARRLRAQLG